MHLKVLGPLAAAQDEGDSIALGGPKQRLVLAQLIVRVNDLVPAEVLIDQVWGEQPPEAAKGTLHSYISHLRKALGPERIEGRPPGYVLHATEDELDAARFERLLSEARLANGSPARTGTVLREALALWTGPAYADLAAEPSLAAEIARLDELRLQALEERVVADLAEGRHGEVVGELEALTRELPLRERLWELLMLALYRSRRPADALAAFERARDGLARELGVDPSPELRRLHERILREDPGLDLEGEPLRGYRLLEQVGEGAFGVVYRAMQPQVGREVAIKAVHPELANHPDFVRRFEREAQIVARLEHPHVVPLYDYWREPDAAYLVMRFLRGGSVEDLLEAGPLDPARAVSILEQVASALAAAHRQGVVHRDVKPGNVLLDEEGNAYLTDFGVALDTGAREKTSGTMMRGTPAYLSPEQIRLDPATPRSDLYALGIVAYEMLTGSHPFPETSLTALLDQHLNDAVPALGNVRQDLAGELDRVIAMATAKGPADRFADVQEFATAFRTAVDGARPVVALIGETRNPYKGLQAFLESDSGDFFGREAVTTRLVQSLAEDDPAARFLAVVGPSGSGKSSVVRAGLVPAIRRGVIPGSERWFVIEMLPGPRPFREIEMALMGIAVDPPPSLMEFLERDELGLVDAVDRVLPDADGELLIVLDQLEEVFTLVHDGAERLRFLDCIRAAVLAPESRIRVVATLRADFYDQPLTVPGFGDLLAARNEAITPMTAEELELAIVAPAERGGLVVEPMLLAAIIGDVAEQPGALPLVQFALTELAERADDDVLRIEAYREIGRVAGALARRADQLLDAMNQDGRTACRQLFLRLVTLGEGSEDTRRRVRRVELLALANAQTMDAVIEAFGRHRLLSFDRDPATREPTVEIAHEALLGAWTRLREWIDEARDDIRAQRQLANAADEWEAGGRDPSFLLRGARLEQTATWAETATLALAEDDRTYLEASVRQRDEESAAERSRLDRERALERRSVRRLRGVVAALSAAALVAGVLTVIATDQSRKAEREASIATARELATASLANLEADPELGVLLATEAVQATRASDGVVLPEAEEALHRAVLASRLEMVVPEVGGALDWSAVGVFVTEGPEGSGLIDIRDDETGESVLSFRGHDGDVNDVAFSSDGSRLASTGDDGMLKVWDVATGRLVASRAGNGPAWGPSFGANDALVAAAWPEAGAWPEGEVRVLDLSTDQVVSTMRWDGPKYGGPNDTALSPDGESVAVTFASTFEPVDGAVYDVRTGEQAFLLSAPNCCSTERFREVSWSPDGRNVAVGSEDAAYVWDAEAERLRHTLLGQSGFVHSVAWSPDSTRLVTGGSDGTARVWEIRDTGVRDLWSLPAHTAGSWIVGVAFSPDGTRVMAADDQISAVKIWDLGPSGDAEWANLPAAWRDGYHMEFMPDARRMVVASRFEGLAGARAVTIWDLQTERDLWTLGPEPDFWFLSFDVSPDGRSIVLGGGSEPIPSDVGNAPAEADGYGGASAVRAWDTSTGEEIYRIGHELDVNDISFSPDGRYVVTASWDGTAKIVDRSGRVIRVLREDGFDSLDLFEAGFSPDGRLVAISAYNESTGGHVTIWDWARDEVVRTFEDANGVAFDPSGLRIATGGPNGLVEIWDVESGSRVGVLHGPRAGQAEVPVFSPDGSRVAVPHTDGTIRLFDADTGTQQLVLPGLGCPVDSAAFSPDGRKLATASPCDGIRIWALDIADLLTIAHREVPRQLTDEECRQYLHLEACPAS